MVTCEAIREAIDGVYNSKPEHAFSIEELLVSASERLYAAKKRKVAVKADTMKVFQYAVFGYLNLSNGFTIIGSQVYRYRKQ
jgi:hypothetical protein